MATPLEFGEPLLQLILDAVDGALHALWSGHVVRGREDVELGVLGDDLTGHRVQGHEPLDLVTEELDADGVLLVDGEHLQRVTAHPERAAAEGEVVPGVLDADELPQQGVAIDLGAHLERDHPVDVLLRSAEAVDARNRRHDNDVSSGEQGVGGRVAEAFNLLVDRGVLLDVGVSLRDVRLGLVVVVVGDEVLDGVLGEELAQLVGELGGKGLVGQHHQGRPLHPLDQPGNRGRLSGAGGAQQHHVLLTGVNPLLEVVDRCRLVT